MMLNKISFLFPFVAGAAWIAALVGLLVYWLGPDGHKQYRDNQPWVVYISDVGGIHKGLFIATCAIVFVFFTLTLVCENYLRKNYMIPGCRYDISALNCQVASAVFGSIGGLFLFLLSCVNLYINSSVHWSFTVVFVVGVGISAILNIVENYRIWEETRLKYIHILAMVKLTLLVLAVIDLIIYIATYAEKGRGSCVLDDGERRLKDGNCGHIASASGATEWALAFIWWLFILTYFFDFLPGVKDVRPKEWRQNNYQPGGVYDYNSHVDNAYEDYVNTHRQQNLSNAGYNNDSHPENVLPGDQGAYAPTTEPTAYPTQGYNPSYVVQPDATHIPMTQTGAPVYTR